METKKDWRDKIIESIYENFLADRSILSFLRSKRLTQQQDRWNNAEISINLKFDMQAIDRWKHKMDNESLKNTLDIPTKLWDFIDYIEEFLLKGKYASKPNYVRLNQEDKSDCLIWNYDNIKSVDSHNKREFLEKLLRLKNEFMYRDNLILICNPKIFREEGQQHMIKILEIKELIPIKDENFICFLDYKNAVRPFWFFEEPLKVHMEYGGGTMNGYYGFYVTWSGALKIKNEEAIKCIRIE